MARWDTVLEEVIRDRRAALVAYASLYVPDRAGAEDLVQEALVRVFGRVRSVNDPYSAEVYVRRAIRTSFLDLARKRKTWQGRAHLMLDDESVPGPEHAVAAGLDVGAALQTLTPRERACAVLRYFDDLPVGDIATELDLSAGSVKRYLSDGTAKLRAALGETEPSVSLGVPTSVPVISERTA